MKEHLSITPNTTKVAIKPVSFPEFWKEIAQTITEIEKRAFALFEKRGREDGHDLDDWFKAELELLEPLSVQIQETEDKVTVRAEIPGFKADEIKLNLEPGLLTLRAARASKTQEKKDDTQFSKTESRQIFRKIFLPVEVLPEKAEATLTNDVLEISAPRKAVAEKGKAIPIKAA